MTDKGLQYEADQRHAEIIMRDMGVDESAKEVATPGVSSIEGGQVQGDQVRGESLFRAVAARGNYFGQDRFLGFPKTSQDCLGPSWDLLGPPRRPLEALKPIRILVDS